MNEIGWPGRPPARIGGGPRAVGPRAIGRRSTAPGKVGPRAAASRRDAFRAAVPRRIGRRGTTFRSCEPTPASVVPWESDRPDPRPLRHGSRRGGFFLRARLRGGSQPQTGPLPATLSGLFRILRARRRHGLPLAVLNISTTVLAMGSFARRTSRDGVVSQMQQQGSSHNVEEQTASQVDTGGQSLITNDQ